ncbi:MAG: prephenate dehydrogenase [Deltaproteobacteria bacterium]
MGRFGTIAIVGTGLIGGSLGMAVKRQGLARRVVGVSRTAASIARARKMGAIDEGSRDLGIIRGADLIVLCLPVKEIVRQAAAIRRLAGRDSVICDAGSTKKEIVEAFRGSNFVGSHPIAGSEKRGVANASVDLFKGSLCVVTPAGATDKAALRLVKDFWSSICSSVLVMTPEEHDRVLAHVSHLPHAVAFALAGAVPDGMLRFAAGGFKGTTRLAGSDPGLWSDIFLSNRKNVLAAIGIYEKALKEIGSAIRDNDGRRLKRLFRSAQAKWNKVASR